MWCGPSGLGPFRFVAFSVCGLFSLRPFRCVAISVAAVSECGRYDLLLHDLLMPQSHIGCGLFAVTVWRP